MSRDIAGITNRVGGKSDGWRVGGVGKASVGSGMEVGTPGTAVGAWASASGVWGVTIGAGAGVKVLTRGGIAATVAGSGPSATGAWAPMPGPICVR